MNLIDVTQQFKTDDDCLDYLEAMRWPDGKSCPFCDHDKVSRIDRGSDTVTRRKSDGTMRTHKRRTRLYQCMACQQQFSPTLGTIFHDSHLPLVKWFMALALLVDARKGMSAKQLQNHLGVAYRTAWYMAHRIRKAMDLDETEFPKLTGVVEVDETYLGGKTVRPFGGRNAKKKDIVIGLRERGGRVRFMTSDDVKARSLKQIIEAFVSDDVELIVTDDFKSYPMAVRKFEGKHRTINHSAGYYVTGIDGQIHTNTVESAFSLLKRGIIGSYHFVSIKHLHRYLAEFEYRFNERKNPEKFESTLRRMLTSEPVQFKELTA
jgi:transposase-like protein